MAIETDIENCYLNYGQPVYLEDGNIECKKRSTSYLIDECKSKNGTVKLDSNGEFINCTLLNSNLSPLKIDEINLINEKNDFLEKTFGYRNQPKIIIEEDKIIPIIFRPKPIPFSTIIITPTVTETNNESIKKEEKNNTQTVVTIVKEIINTGKVPDIKIPSTKKSNNTFIYSYSNDDDIEKIIIKEIEGGYYNVAHSDVFSQSNKNTFKISGETLWGIDRFAGAGEFNSESNLKALYTEYWVIIDKYSGYGKHASYSKLHSLTTKYTLDKNGKIEIHRVNGKNTSQLTEAWDFKNHPKISTAWPHYKNPNVNEELKKLQTIYSKIVIYTRNSLIDKNFKNHELKNIIYDDGRLLFAQQRASFNGSGFFQKYANELKKNYDAAKIAKTIPAEKVAKGTYILALDLSGRNKLYLNNSLIQKDIKKIKDLSAST